MAKNMTRKGLAVGIAATFVASGLGSLPASASDEVLTLGPSAGSGYTTLAGSTFTLTPGFPSTVTGDTVKYLKYRIVNDSLTDIDIDMTDGADGGDIVSNKYGNAGALDTATTDIDGQDDDDFVVSPASFTGGDPYGQLGVVNTLTLTNDDAGDAFSVDVTAWLDLNNNNTIDAGEFYSPTRTVTFVAHTDVTAVPTLATPVEGDATLVATVAFSNADINVRQIDDGDVLVQFGTVASDGTFTTIDSFAFQAAGTSAPAGTTSTTVTATGVDASNNFGNDVTWNSTLGQYEARFDPFDTVIGDGDNDVLSAVAEQKYGAKLFLDNNDDGTTAVTDTQEGSTATATVGATAALYSVKWNLVGTANAITTQVGYEDSNSGTFAADGYTDNQEMTGSVRATSTSASDSTLSIFVGTDVTVPVGVANVPVVVTVSDGTGVTPSDNVTVEGLSVHNDQSRVITKSTNSSGVATFEIVGGKADANDRLDFSIVVNGTAMDGAADDDAQVTFVAADYDINMKDDLSGNGGVSITSGATYTIDYDVLDQFGVAPANGLYRVVVQDKQDSNAERTTAANFAFDAPVVDGVASVSITDNGVGNGSYTLEAGWALTNGSIDTTAGQNDSVETTVSVVTDATPATVTIDAMEADHYGSAQLNDANSDGDYSDASDTDNRTELVLETESLSTYIGNTAAPSASAPDLTTGLEVTIEGTVTNAAGTAVPYAPVTLSAGNFLFVTNSNYVLDEITVYADSSGDFSVDVYSQSSGINNITITSGSATATQQLTYAGATSGAAADFTVTTPGASEPGRTVDVIVDVVDANGNAVEGASMTLSSTGPGYLINTSGTTLSDGSFTTKLLLGANDSGTAEVKVAITIDGDEVIKTSSIVVGVGAVAAADQKVNAGSFKGYVAVYAKGYAGQRLSAKIGNDWVIVPSLASNFERIVDFTGAGVDISVRIYIDRVLQDTIALTTK